MAADALGSTPLSVEDRSFWYADQPRQRITMAMLMLLDRAPDPQRLAAAAWRMVEAVPRLRQRVVDALFDLALPRLEEDPTSDLAFHVRRHAMAAEGGPDGELDALFQRLGPIYERPFDRTRPLWELIEIDRPGGGSAIFFRLHHAVADGVGGNAIFAALTDAERAGDPLALPPAKPPGAWPERSAVATLARALRDRAALGGRMIDVPLTAVAGATGPGTARTGSGASRSCRRSCRSTSGRARRKGSARAWATAPPGSWRGCRSAARTRRGAFATSGGASRSAKRTRQPSSSR